MLVRKVIEDKALGHIKNMLDYDNSVCDCLKNKLETFDKDIFTFLPNEIDEKGIEKINQGGILSKNDNYLAKYINDNYREDNNYIVLFDDVMATASDEFLKEYEDTLFLWGEDVYHYIPVKNGIEKLNRLIWATSVSWHFVCVILKAPNLHTKDIFSKHITCEYIVDNLAEIVVGAFDGEGFIHCKRQIV